MSCKCKNERGELLDACLGICSTEKLIIKHQKERDILGEKIDHMIIKVSSEITPNNTLSEISSAGYLDNYIQTQNFSVLSTDIIAVVGSNGTQWYKPVFTAGSCRLTVLP